MSDVKKWSVDDVVTFLQRLELDAITEEFKTHAVNGEDLLELTDDDLQNELKLTTLQIRKIRKELGKLTQGEVTVSTAAPEPISAVPVPVVFDQPVVAHGFDPASISELKTLTKNIQQLEMQQVELASETASRRVSDIESSLRSRESDLQQLQGTQEKLTKQVEKCETGGCCVFKKDSRLEKYRGELSQVTEQIGSTQKEITSLRTSLGQARQTADDLKQPMAQLIGLKRQKRSLEDRMIMTWAASDAGAQQMAQEAQQLDVQHSEIQQVSRTYQSATSDLQGALSNLKTAINALQRGRAATTVGMVQAARGRGRGRGPLGRPPMAATMMTTVDLRRANDLVQNAAVQIQNAQHKLPSEIPFIQHAAVRSAAAGIFTSMLLGGLAGQVVMSAQVRSSMRTVEDMAQQVGQALSWLQQQASGYYSQAAQAEAQLRMKQQEKTNYETRALQAAIAAAS